MREILNLLIEINFLSKGIDSYYSSIFNSTYYFIQQSFKHQLINIIVKEVYKYLLINHYNITGFFKNNKINQFNIKK